MNQVFGADVQTVDPGLDTWFLFDNAITVLQIKVVGFLIAVALGIFLAVFMKKTRLGQAIRATAQDARSARILGVDTNKVYAITFAINAAICGAAGALVAMTCVIQPFAGLAYTIRSFMIVIIAGLGNVAGVIFAGLGLGAAENFAGFLLGAEFQAAFIFSLLVVILVWRNFKLRLQRGYLK
jgi:branched-chain amino acid transport system permease protein